MKSLHFKKWLLTLALPLALMACNESGTTPGSVNNTGPTPISNPTSGPTNNDPQNPTSPTSPGNGSSSSASREWTYMVYMGADNSLAEDGINDLIEMETIGSTDAVAVVVQGEFPTKVKQESFRVLVEKDNDNNTVNLKNAQDIGNVNMADPKSMTDFIAWAAKTYPAKNYALVVWDHGAGWKASPFPSQERGAVEDATSKDFMSLPELAQGVRSTGVHFGVINFDACLMGMYEVAYEYAGLADFMVYSEEVTPGPGNPYDIVLETLVSNPTIKSADLAVSMATIFHDFYVQVAKWPTQIAAIDVNKITALDKKLREFSVALTKEKGFAALVQAAEKQTQQYDYKTNHDLYNLASNLAKALPNGNTKKLAQDVMNAVTSAVSVNKIDGADLTNSHGLAIYLPMAGEVDAAEFAEYEKLAINKDVNSSWGTFIQTYLAASGYNTDDPTQGESQGVGEFGALLEWEGCNADLDLLVYEPTGNGKGNLYTSAIDTQTPNGNFLIDDDSTSYVANKKVTSGEYTVLVKLRKMDANCKKIKAHLYIIDPNNDIAQWTELTKENGFNIEFPSPHEMSFKHPDDGSEINSLADLNSYSDWWVPVTTSRAYDEVSIESVIDAELQSGRRTDYILMDLDGRF